MNDSMLDSIGSRRCCSVASRCARPVMIAPMVMRFSVLPTTPPRPRTANTIEIAAATRMKSSTKLTFPMPSLSSRGLSIQKFPEPEAARQIDGDLPHLFVDQLHLPAHHLRSDPLDRIGHGLGQQGVVDVRLSLEEIHLQFAIVHSHRPIIAGARFIEDPIQGLAQARPAHAQKQDTEPVDMRREVELQVGPLPGIEP